MIGGYFYSRKDDEIDARLRQSNAGCRQIDVFENGYFFCTNPFQPDAKTHAASDSVIVLSEDLLVFRNGAQYRAADLTTDVLPEFERQGPRAFDSIQSDFRMAAGYKAGPGRILLLASNRAGAGRIYYQKLKEGIVFSSDLRFLLKVVPFEISRKGIYSLLKYGCIPEPLTISEHVSAVPAAHYLKYEAENGQVSLAPYFRLQFPTDTNPAPFDEEKSLEEVKKILQKTAGFLGTFPSAMLLSGGIDSSLYGCYLNQKNPGSFQGFYCSFGQYDPEYRHACAIADRLGVKLQVAIMEKPDALRVLDDAARLTDHPFSDFSTLPIVFLLQHIRDRQSENSLIIECNGGDDCFGYAALGFEQKYRLKHSFPGVFKKLISETLVHSSCWKWESSEGFLARIAALADVHEKSYLNYFLIQGPMNYLQLDSDPRWDDSLQDTIEQTAVSCGEDYTRLSYQARTTIRQLLYVNSARWTAKALSVGESLGKRVVYPFIWRDVLLEQGKLPWSAKIHNGIVKWPLKRLLEEYMPGDFIYRKKSGFVPPFVRWLTDSEFNDKVRDVLSGSRCCVTEIIPSKILQELLSDAREGKKLRSPILNILWGAFFTESWIKAVVSSQRPNFPPQPDANLLDNKPEMTKSKINA